MSRLSPSSLLDAAPLSLSPPPECRLSLPSSASLLRQNPNSMDKQIQNLDYLCISSIEHKFDLKIEKSIESDNDFEYDEDYLEDEQEEEINVQIGILKKTNDPKLLLRQLFPSKAGGVPAWLNPEHLPGEISSICGFCNEPLKFVLQIYAYGEEKHAFHRMLYVFICPSMSCLLKDQDEQLKGNADNPRRSVKVFRCQLPRSNPYYLYESPKNDGSYKPLTIGAALCSWCNTWLGNKICSNCRTTRYCSKVHQSMHWQSDHKMVCRQVANSSKASTIFNNGICKSADKNSAASRILYEEYEIAIGEECTLDSELVDDLSSTNTLVPSNEYQNLPRKFKANNDGCFERFKERTKRDPEQVLRYCGDPAAKPLWPLLSGRPTVADIPNCSCCGGPMSYEFQILPQFLTKIGAKNDYNSLDWATVVVYTCSASCKSRLSYIPEFAWVQLFPTGWTL